MATPKKKTTKKTRVAVRSSRPAKKRVSAPEHAPMHEAAAVPLVMYKRIAITFVVIVAFALMVVLYLATMQAVIHVDAFETEHSAEFIVTASESPTSELQVSATLASGVLAKTATVQASGEGAIEQLGTATGTVTLYNKMGTDQPLVQTTRLLTPDGVLFRLSEGVTVPAGGSVEAPVYADQAGASGDIDPATFTIPGLTSAKQALVYAQSTEAFSGGVTMLSVVTQEEIDAALTKLSEEVFMDASMMLRDEAQGTFTGEVFRSEVQASTASIDPNTQAETFDVRVELEVAAVFYDADALKQMAIAKLYEGLGQGQEFVNIATDALRTTLEAFNEETGQASLRTTLVGKAIPSRASERLEVSRFVGMKADDVRDVLVREGIAEDVTVEFFPFWVRKIPQLRDHVYIEIE